MTLEELSHNKFFLEGLRKGEYCLVLGAGFSIGLKNKTTPDSLSKIDGISYHDFNTIPLVSEYVSITNKIFTDTVTKGEAAANTWEYNRFSIAKDEEIIDLKPFYRDLFTLDEDWFRENEIKNYKNILLPDWYQIYTFNFDNVFETIVKLKARNDFYSLHFPEHEGDANRRTLNKAIHHLHGYILETTPEKLTFSQETYDVIDSAPHTLYDPFHVDIATGKKLVIIGNQFDERTIDKKFFEGLKKKNITIYHFSRDNNDFKTKPGISGNPNYHFIKITDTHEVLTFFEQHKTQIENIRIEGADVINSDFIDKVKADGKKEGFTSSDFYLAKQVEECQWYGITQNWAIERDHYDYIKQETISSIADTKRTSKITALVWGLGGSGKSTLLRQLAVDFSNEDFTVLWVIDKSIQSFYDKGLAQLRSDYTHKRFLIIIEDLYRIKQQVANLKEIINSICSNSNVRLIVGDRKHNDSTYKEFIYNPDQNIIELTVNNNRETINKLLVNIPDWKSAADKLLKNDDDYKSTLYYILWTIGRTAQKEKEGFLFDKQQDFTSHFRSLVQSDLKALFIDYGGVAKMLYYWACIYAKNKLYIGYELFFKLAELFKPPSTNESNRILASPTHKSILDIYSHKADVFIKIAGELSLFAFNHDILAEDGLSKSPLSGWHPFDDSINLAMLPIVIRDGDSFSASNFFWHCLTNISDVVFTKEEKKEYITKLKAKGNFNSYLIPALKKELYSANEKIELANEILAQDNFWNLSPGIVTTALNISKNETKANEILAQDNFWNLNQGIVTAALNISKNKAKANEILVQEHFWNLDQGIVIPALNISKNVAKANEILAQDNFWNLAQGIVTTALNISKNEAKVNEILAQENFWNLEQGIVTTALNISKSEIKANEILAQENFWNLEQGIVTMALNISKNEAKSIEILSQENFWNLEQAIVTTALNISKSEAKANEILARENFWNLRKEIVSTALNISKNETKANEILAHENFWNLDQAIVTTALNISNDAKLKELIGSSLFASGYWKEKWKITFHIMVFYSKQNHIPASVVKITNTIISDFLNPSNKAKGKLIRYVDLMFIPLFTIDAWQTTSLENIRRWEYRARNIVANSISSHSTKPSIIKVMCSEILKRWKNEIIKPIIILGKNIDPHYGDHIRLSLGHPDLKKLAKQTALEIKEAESQSPGIIPEHLLNVVNKIIDENAYPIWNPDHNDKEE